ncbi:MAG: cupredoxin domain-containing protein [Patescibacteria group bacterium]|nr:cupredoxin domain-containing protein [Patescibacteria group bacterium]
MSPDKIIVTIIGVAAIGATYWFFLLKKDQVVAAGNSVEVKVEGGYSPTTIKIAKHKPTTLVFLRTDKNDCLEEVVIPEFKVRQYLPVNQKVSIAVTPTKAGEFPFSCGMGMYHGKIVVQ